MFCELLGLNPLENSAEPRVPGWRGPFPLGVQYEVQGCVKLGLNTDPSQGPLKERKIDCCEINRLLIN